MFDRANGAQFDYVINCGGEHRISQPDDVYRLRVHALSVGLGREAARRGIRAYVECSTATVYKGDPKPRKEGDRTKPWYNLSKWKLAAEEDLRRISGLNLCILRLANVYGEYDTGFLTTGICLGRAYKELDKELAFLNTRDQAMNTVYVKDAARALWTAASWRASIGTIASDDKSTPILFNVVDHNNTLKGDFAAALASTFGIECSFLGSAVTQLAKLNLEELVDEMNEETLEVWAEILNRKGIQRPGPISPFLEKEVLKDSSLCIDGTLFERTTGFRYQREKLPPDWIESIIKSFERMGWWP
jgi:nucleoside-diphosphate-sugar epimerase